MSEIYQDTTPHTKPNEGFVITKIANADKQAQTANSLPMLKGGVITQTVIK